MLQNGTSGAKFFQGTILHQDRPLFLSPAFRERISDDFGNAFSPAELRLFLKSTGV